MEIRLPEEKLARIKETLRQWLTKKNATKQKILSLVGQLQHATKVVRCGCTFTARMYGIAAELKKLHYYTRLNRQFHSDLALWYTFFVPLEWLKYPTGPSTTPPTQITIQTDASGSWGCSAVHGHLRLQLRWSGEWECQDIMAIELIPAVLMMAVWGRPQPITPKILPILLLSIAQKLSLSCPKLCF